MAQPKNTYTFSSTRLACDYRRILNENSTSGVIVLSRPRVKGCEAITIVRRSAFSALQNLKDADINSVVTIDGIANVYIGDVHGKALGIVETKVEAY